MILVPFKAHHLRSIDLRNIDTRVLGAYPDLTQRLAYMEAVRGGFTGIADGKVVGAAGVFRLWNGVGEGWIIGSIHLRHHTLSLCRTVLRSLEILAQSLDLRRIQGASSLAYPTHAKWLRTMGFVQETDKPMRGYGPDGGDYHLFARYF